MFPDGSLVPQEEGLTASRALANQLKSELELDGKAVTGSALAVVAQNYEDAEGFGQNALRAAAAKFLASSHKVVSPVYESIAALPFPLIITTCQDNALYKALTDTGKVPFLCRYHFRGDRRDNPEFVHSGSPQAPTLYHLFGDAEEPQSLVLSENDLLDFLIGVVAEKPPLPNSFKRALQRTGQSFLFMGFGVSNWYLRILLKVIVRSLELNRTGSTMALEGLQGLTDTDRQQTVLFYQRGTRVEFYEEDLQAFAVEFLARLKAAGWALESKAGVGPRPRVFVSYASEDTILAARLFSSLQKAQFEPWLDKDALRGGDDWNSKIEDQLRDSDYVLVLETPALARKRVGYVNKEISIARDLARYIRGSFLIPVYIDDLDDHEKISELSGYQAMQLRESRFEEDFANLSSLIRRDFQRRQR